MGVQRNSVGRSDPVIVSRKGGRHDIPCRTFLQSRARALGALGAYCSSKTYWCCESRTTSVRLAPAPTTNSKPCTPGAVVTNERPPSGFLREAASLFHSPKSKTVAPPGRPPAQRVEASTSRRSLGDVWYS